MTFTRNLAVRSLFRRILLLSTLLALVLPRGSHALPPSDGDLDLRYGVDGFGRLEVSRSDYSFPNAVACRKDGFCFLAATVGLANQDFSIFRTNAQAVFDNGAAVAFDLGGNDNDQPIGVALQADGSCLAVGVATDSATAGNTTQAAIARVTPDANLDVSFSGDGRDNVNFVGTATSVAVATTPDNKIVVAGCYQTGGANGTDIFVLRYTSAGLLDNSFDGNGIKTFGFDLGGAKNECAYALAIESNGNIVVAGYASISSSDSDFAVARLLGTNGALDPAFSGDGKTTVFFDLGGVVDAAHAVAIDRFGRIVVAGVAVDASHSSHTAIARLAPDGSLPTAPGNFGTNGRFVGAADSEEAFGVAIAPPPSNRIYYATFNGFGALTGTGAVDPSFSGDGLVPFDDPLPGVTSQSPWAMSFAGGMVTLAGGSSVGALDYNVIARYWIQQIFGDDFESASLNAWSGW
ncbi:MAG: hypothetical protein ABI639_06170 [Thermoanaerobaculia bacterium]